ncbi:MAG: class I SAM-dependent methyltransferase family protein [Candidatus Bathyarchaeota archaeon]|nr:class I SAM-dependent methyltransferase family protein [Candidatus Bathyarchaeota archaeon]
MPKHAKKSLANVLAAEGVFGVYSSFDVVGDIAIVKSPSKETAQAVGKAILRRHSNVKTVLAQTGGVRGDYRLRKLWVVAGENKTKTVHKESGCLFSIDVQSCYFSPRLQHERRRIAKQTQPHETIVNMFAGVGCFSLVIAKKVPSTKIYSIDINPTAYEFIQENIQLNHASNQVFPMLGDAKELIQSHLQGQADRVLMPLPEKALSYLPCAISALKPQGGYLHVHIFEHATKHENPKEKTRKNLQEHLDSTNKNYAISHMRLVRHTGPNWFHLVADVQIT